MRAELQTSIDALLDDLQAGADPQRAPAMQAYMRERFRFLGIATPMRRRISAPFVRSPRTAPELLLLAQHLFAQPMREAHYVALDLLARQWKVLTVSDIPALLALARRNAWWDSVDPMAGVVGDILRRARREQPQVQRLMDEALRHRDLWVRRIAMLHQLGWRGDTDTQRLYGYALALAAEEDFFIRKAIGWALRDFARHDPKGVGRFLAQHRDTLSPLTVREAGKHLGGPA